MNNIKKFEDFLLEKSNECSCNDNCDDCGIVEHIMDLTENINESIKGVERTESGKIKYRGELFPGFNKPKRAPKGDKHKYRVLAKDGNKIGIVSFGARGYDDFLQHKDTKRRKNFRARMNCDKKHSKLTAKYWVCHYNW